MDYFNQIKNLVSVLKLEKEGFIRVAMDKSATFLGIFILIVPPILDLILASQAFPSGFSVMFSRFMMWPMFIPVLSISGVIFLMSFTANKLFNGIKDHIGFFRTVSYSSVILVVTIVPFILGFFGILDPIGLFNLIWMIGSIWIFVVSYNMLLIHHKLSKQDAIAVIVIGIIGYFIIRNILGGFLVGESYRFWY